VRIPLRWRAAADVVSTVLGLNLWLALMLVPALSVGSFRDRPWLLAVAALPLVVLALGVTARSATTLLLWFPASLLVPLGVDPRLATGPAHGPLSFGVAAASLVAFALGSAFFSAFHEPPPPERMRVLGTGAALPSRWRRRFRVYRALVVLSVAFPAVLLYAVNGSPTNQAYLRELFPGRAAAMTVVLDLGILALWGTLFALHFQGLLRLHRSGDAELVRELDKLRVEVRRGRPRPVFFVAVAAALALMGLLVFLRYR
jgi:hypothetical protein